jgi:thiol reductant ABC exporter CydC subunit
MGLAILAGFATIASSIGLLATSAYIISFAALQPSIAELQVAIVSVRFFGIARGALRYVERLMSHDVAFRLIARLRVWFFCKLEPLAPARLMHYRSGDLLRRIVGDVDTLEFFFIRVIAPPFVALAVSALTLVLLGSFDTRLALSIVGIQFLAGVILPVTMLRWGRDSGRRLVEVRADLKAALVETLQGSADILACGQELTHLDRLHGLSQRLTDMQFRFARRDALAVVLNDFAASLAALVALALSIPLIRQGQIEGMYLAVILLATMASFEAIAPLAATFQQLEEQGAAADRLFEIIDAVPDIAEPPEPRMRTSDHSIYFDSVCFRYTSDLPLALDRIDFELPMGGKLAIVGANGSGKTSIVNLLLQFWDYQEGSIRLGKDEIRDYPPDILRKMISVVPQRSQFLNDSIRNNLLLAQPEAGQAQLEAAAQCAQILEFIHSLPQGFDTRIGEGGQLLSAGERQRLSVVRGLLKDAPLLILDEPTTHLDAITEHALMDNLLTWSLDQSLLLITHRLVNLDRMDQIIVLRQGRIAEHGSHTSLIERKGIYWRLWQRQNQIDLMETLGDE